ncbi:replication protein [Paraliobacillus ryukyuensis]|uniref:replication protein n=1 Tax=Paraliobacillus ryukyuensis TaxID=200904 RepID=UPI002118D09D|nr:replication protein [Paraliobacillus ryukyuensis]
MWNNPVLYRKYKAHDITSKTFTSKLWYFYYRLGETMWNSGVRTFDEETTISFITSQANGKVKSKFDEYGGYDTVGYVKEWCESEKNNEEYHLSEIQKYESLRSLESEGLIDTSNEKLVEKLAKGSLKNVQTFFNHKFKHGFKNVNSGQIEFVDLVDDDIYEDIKEARKGVNMGVPIFHAPRLTKTLKGWKEGKMGYLVLPSGVGKSTIARALFVMTLITQNKKGLVFINEESKSAWRLSLLSVVATYVLDKRISRDKIFEGNWDDYVDSVLNEAADWLLEHRPNMLKLAILKKFRFEDVLNWVEYYKAHGITHMILDTFKPDGSETDMARWQVFGSNAQDLYDLVKEENLNIGTLATLQLKIGRIGRFLDHDSVGKSKEVVEVADYTMLGRLLFADEYEGGKNSIRAFNYAKNPFGKWDEKEYTLDPKKEYLILFFGKNRLGSASKQIIFEINYDFNEIKEVAYAEMKPIAPSGM